jgi:hypothetical protein
MANYYDFSVVDVTDPDCVGVSTGDGPNDSPRICISLEGAPINSHIVDRVVSIDSSTWAPDGRTWVDVNWRALTLTCAKELYELLGSLKHLWETP